MDLTIRQRYPTTGNGDPPKKPQRPPTQDFEEPGDDAPVEDTPTPEK